jgi:hypothetical protein
MLKLVTGTLTMSHEWSNKNPSTYEGFFMNENQELKKHLKWCLDLLEEFPMEPSHEGFCSPETNCDFSCSDAYYFQKRMEEIRKLVN